MYLSANVSWALWWQYYSGLYDGRSNSVYIWRNLSSQFEIWFSSLEITLSDAVFHAKSISDGFRSRKWLLTLTLVGGIKSSLLGFLRIHVEQFAAFFVRIGINRSSLFVMNVFKTVHKWQSCINPRINTGWGYCSPITSVFRTLLKRLSSYDRETLHRS